MTASDRAVTAPVSGAAQSDPAPPDVALPVGGGVPWYINGRAGTGGPGGFARFHHEVTARLGSTSGATVLEPRVERRGLLASRWWEQQELARQSEDGILLSTANNGPVRHRNHVVVVHDLLPLTHPRTVSPIFAAAQRVQLPRLCRRAAAVITVSRQVAAQLDRLVGVDRDRITVIPPGIGSPFRARTGEDAAVYTGPDRAVASRFGLDQDRPIVSALVSSIPRKNSTAILDVLHRLSVERPEVQAVVAGVDGPSRVFGRRATRPTHPEVRDLGPIDDPSLATLFGLSDLFLSLPEAEGFGLPPLEALAAGTAVVTTPVPSVVEHLPEHPTVPFEDCRSHALAALKRLLDQPEARLAQVLAARAPLADLTWGATAAAVVQVLIRLESDADD